MGSRHLLRRIAVVLEHGWVETQAFIREPIVHLAAEGIEVDLLARETDNWSPIPGVRYLPRRSLWTPSGQAAFARLLGRGVLRRDYDLVLANPAVSLVIGDLLARGSGAPLVVWHDELWTDRDVNLSPRLRAAMYRAHARADLTVVTDLRRMEVLEADCPALGSRRVVELPNAPSGAPAPARDRSSVRRDLGIDDDVTMVLNAGSLTKRFGLDDLLGVLPDLPARTMVVMQSAMHTHRLDPAVLALVEARYPVRFRLDPRPYPEVDDLVTAADIGVALYHGSIPNVRYVGKGSGKLSRYLRAGKPVIVDRNASLEFVEGYGAGVVVDDPSQVPAAIDAINARYDDYVAGARRCFAEELSFERHWPAVRAAIGDLVGGSAA